jgi:hypothetical protein
VRLCDEREGDRAERGRAVKTVRTFERFARAGDEVCGGDGSAFDGSVINPRGGNPRGGAKARAARGDAERGTKRNEAKRSEKLFKKLA